MHIASRPPTLVLAAALALALTAPVTAQTLRIALQEDPDRLDPAQGATFVGRIVFAALCDKLIDIDANLKYRPQLATQWSWSEDGKALVMQIRSGVVFHDGTPLDSEAVKINIDRYRTADYSRRKTEVKSIVHVAAIDRGCVGRTLRCRSNVDDRPRHRTPVAQPPLHAPFRHHTSYPWRK